MDGFPIIPALSFLVGISLIGIYIYPALTGRIFIRRWRGRRWFRGDNPKAYSRGMVLIGVGLCVNSLIPIPDGVTPTSVLLSFLGLFLMLVGAIVAVYGSRSVV